LDSRIIDDLDELKGMGDAWERVRRECGGSVFSSHYASMAWLESFHDAVRPMVAVAEEGGQVIGVAPMVRKRQSFARLPVRSLSLIGDADGMLTMDPLMLMAPPDRPDVLDELVRALGRPAWSLMNLKYMEDSRAARSVLDRVSGAWGSVAMEPMMTTVCPLPRGGELWDHFGRNTRHKIQQYLRKAEREHPLEFVEICLSRMDSALDVYAEQHRRRWASRGGSIFEDGANLGFLKRLMREAWERGEGQAFELRLGGEVAAQEFSLIDGDLVRGYRLGMSDDFGRYAPGMLTTYLAMADCRERGFSAFSLGSGGEAYKLRMIGEERPLLGMQARRGLAHLLSRAAHPTAAGHAAPARADGPEL